MRKKKINYVWCQHCDNEFEIIPGEADVCPHCDTLYEWEEESDEEPPSLYMSDEGDWD